MNSDMFKIMVVNQGYVPSTCVIDGQFVWLMINDGKDPCKGCHINREICKGRYDANEN